MKAIPAVRIPVALKDSGESGTFKFSRTGMVPGLVLKLSSGRMALRNVSFLVADDETACEELLVGLPVLRHLGIDSRRLLEQNWNNPDGTECTIIERSLERRSVGHLGRLMTARLKNTETPPTPNLDPQRTRAKYYDRQTEEDPFPDPFVLQADDGQEEKTRLVRLSDPCWIELRITGSHKNIG